MECRAPHLEAMSVQEDWDAMDSFTDEVKAKAMLNLALGLEGDLNESIHELENVWKPAAALNERYARGYQTELTLALASLETAQALCVAKDEAILRTLHSCEMRLRALTNNCGAPVTTKLERMRTALESIVEYWNGNNNERAMLDACEHNIETARKALEDQ